MKSLGAFTLLLLSLFIVLGCSFCQQAVESIGQIQDSDFYGEALQFGEPGQGEISILPQPVFGEEAASISQPWVLQPSIMQLYVTATPARGDAPLVTMLKVVGMQAPYWLWDLDWDGDGDMDTGGQGPPTFQVTYDTPGSYSPQFTFYNDANQIIARATGFLTVTGTGLPRLLGALPPADRIIATPTEGRAPLHVTLDARSIAPSSYSTWSLDQYSGGVLSYPGGEPVAQVIYENPGAFNATIVFYDSQLREIARGRASVLVLDDGTSGQLGPGATGTSRQALTAAKSGGSEPKAIPSPINLENTTWVPPKEQSTTYLKADLQAFPERGSVPLAVRFDASKSFARYNMSTYSYDIAWGPEDKKDDGYYLISSSDPRWTYTFREPGLYLAILDVEDKDGNKARVTKVITVFDSNVNLSPSANLSAHPTRGSAPLTVKFTVQPQVRANANEAAYAYWDFNLSDSELSPVGGDIAIYGTVDHTYDKPGSYTAGVTLMGIDRDAGPTATIDIHVDKNNPPSAYIIASPTTGPAPLQVRLQGYGSWDTEGKIVRYTWYPDCRAGDPVISTTDPDYTYVYTVPGSYRASLNVTDQGGLISDNDAHVDIQVALPGLEPKG